MKEWLSAREALKQVWEDYLDKMPLARIGVMYWGMTHDLVQGINATPSKRETKMLKAYAATLRNYADMRPVFDPSGTERKMLANPSTTPKKGVMDEWVERSTFFHDDPPVRKSRAKTKR